MQTRLRHLIILTTIFLLALGLIYLLSNQKFMFIDQSNKISSSCETRAEKQTREDLKQKYGDALSRDFVLGSPHYKNRLNQCLSEK